MSVLWHLSENTNPLKLNVHSLHESLKIPASRPSTCISFTIRNESVVERQARSGILRTLHTLVKSCPEDWSIMADNAIRSFGKTVKAVPAEHTEAATTPNVSSEGKWTGGIRGLLMDCPVDAAWELASDWVNWQRWFPGNPRFELREGENRKAGCLRYVAATPNVPEAWCNERLLVIDDEKHFLSYNVEENELFGGLVGYIVKAQLRGTDDGKTMVEYYKYEIEPVENQTPETFSFIMMNVYKKYLKDLERGAQRLAAGLDPKPDRPPVVTEAPTAITY